MVAASDDTGALSVRAAILCLVFIIAGTAVALAFSARTNVLGLPPFSDSPEIMVRKARDLAQRVGYLDAPADTASGFSIRNGLITWARSHLKAAEYDGFLKNARTSRLGFWYRQSPRPLATIDGAGFVSTADPPPVVSGMVETYMDPEGRLIYFRAVSPQQIDKAPAHPVDWKPLFAAAGLDPTQWTPTTPELIPLSGFDELAAWTGTFSHSPSVPMRVEAAAWKGRPVSFEIRGPWNTADRDTPARQASGQVLQTILADCIAAITFCLAAGLAWFNYRRGRVDIQGGIRLAGLILGSTIVSELLFVQHVDAVAEFNKLASILAVSLWSASGVVFLYVALEPFVRRRWPHSLISSTRLLAGGLTDSLVGGHILIGTAIAVGTTLLFRFRILAEDNFQAPFVPVRRFVGETVSGVAIGITTALALLFLLFLARVLVRNQWLAAAIVVLFFTVLQTAASPHPAVVAVVSVLQYASAVVILTRFGVLPMVVVVVITYVLVRGPLTTDVSAWYANTMFAALAIVLAISLWSFKTALGGRKLWTGDFLER
jgi:hypothetical protein